VRLLFCAKIATFACKIFRYLAKTWLTIAAGKRLLGYNNLEFLKKLWRVGRRKSASTLHFSKSAPAKDVRRHFLKEKTTHVHQQAHTRRQL
jgi:hypothetical protein